MRVALENNMSHACEFLDKVEDKIDCVAKVAVAKGVSSLCHKLEGKGREECMKAVYQRRHTGY
jgi:hypothetical protein